jgi:hypothetical protein
MRALAVAPMLAVAVACGAESTTVGSMNARTDSGADGASVDATADASLDVSTDASACVIPNYPPGPYGVLAGNTMSPQPQWQGYLGNVQVTVRPSDYFDPAQCHGAAALFVVEVDATDPTSVDVTTLIAQDLAGPWANGRVRVLELLTRGATGNPATLSDVQAFQQAHGVTWTIAADPAETYQDQSGFYPQIRLVVDTCTMKITRWVHRDPVDADATLLGARLTCP